MSFTHTLSRSWLGTNGAAMAASVQKTADQEVNISAVVAADSTSLVHACVIDQSALSVLVINTDKAATLVCKAAGGSTVNTFTMVANQPIMWAVSDSGACPLSGDIATIEVTTGAVGNTQFDVRALIDPTPA